MAGSTKSRYKITKQKKQKSKCWYTLEWTIKTRVHLKRAHCFVVTNWVYLLLARVIHVVALSHWNISVSHSWGKKEDSASASASQWMQITRATTSHHLLWDSCERFFNSKFVQCTKKLIRFSLSLGSSTVLTLLMSARAARSYASLSGFILWDVVRTLLSFSSNAYVHHVSLYTHQCPNVCHLAHSTTNCLTDLHETRVYTCCRYKSLGMSKPSSNTRKEQLAIIYTWAFW